MKWEVKSSTSSIADTGDYYTQYWLEKEGWPTIYLSTDDEDFYKEMAERLNSQSIYSEVKEQQGELKECKASFTDHECFHKQCPARDGVCPLPWHGDNFERE